MLYKKKKKIILFRARIISSRDKRIQTSFLCIGYRGLSSPGMKWQGREPDHSPPSSAETKNDGAISELPKSLHGMVLN
jgi:hypothetical protein